MPILIKLISACVIALTLSLPAALAAPVRVTVDGTQWDISSISGTFLDNEALLTRQPWWVPYTGHGSYSSTKAMEFAAQYLSVADASAPPLDFVFFDYSWIQFNSDFLASFCAGCPHWPPTNDPIRVDRINYRTYDYAIATEVAPVPLPAAGLMLFAALAGVAGLGYRRKAAA